MTEHVRQKNAVQEIDDTELISSAIDKCNLRPEYKRLLKILYVERGCLEDVCDAVGRDYSTVSKWHKPALIRLVRLLQKQGKINAKIAKEKISLQWYNGVRCREIFCMEDIWRTILVTTQIRTIAVTIRRFSRCNRNHSRPRHNRRCRADLSADPSQAVKKHSRHLAILWRRE